MESRGRFKDRVVGEIAPLIGTLTSYPQINNKPPVVTKYKGTPYIKYEAVAYNVHDGPPFKTGGPFALRRYQLTRSTAGLNYRYWVNPNFYPVWGDSFKGEVYGDFSQVGLANEFSYSQFQDKIKSVSFPSQNLNAYYAEAANRLNPLNLRMVSMSQAVAELLKDGIPSVPGLKLLKDRARKAIPKSGKAGGSEFLNVQFGWTPIVNDIISVYKAYRKADDVLRQIIRDNNRPVRRRVTLYRDESRNEIGRAEGQSGVRTYPFGFSQNPMDGHLLRATAEERKSTRVWAVGRGKYYIPDVQSVEFSKKFRKELFGSKPNLSLLYELMPWSWLIDWVTNVGDLVNLYLDPNVGEFVWDYMYIMRHVQHDVYYKMNSFSYTYEGATKSYRASFPGFTAEERRETKERIASTPFGFGLKLEDLSSRQLAILGALGLSRQSFV